VEARSRLFRLHQRLVRVFRVVHTGALQRYQEVPVGHRLFAVEYNVAGYVVFEVDDQGFHVEVGGERRALIVYGGC
jgi:hypothetical protein